MYPCLLTKKELEKLFLLCQNDFEKCENKIKAYADCK